MKHREFKRLFDNGQIRRCKKMFQKGNEYSSSQDQFHNFKAAGRKKNITPEDALMGMKLKHDVSVDDIVENLENGILPAKKILIEKLDDSIIYLSLLEGLIIERIENEQ